MNEIEQFKSGKDIEDIVSERNKIQKLIYEANWDKLNTYLQELNIKYGVETFIYNLANPIQPKGIQENAQNCIRFLNTLIADKIKDSTQDNE